MASLTGPFFGVEAFLNGSGMNPNEDQEFLQNINPQPIDPLNRNQFDPNAFGLQTQVNDDTFSPRPGTSLQDMLTQRELQANPGEPNFINAPQDFYPQSGQVGNFINAPQDFYQENPIENLGFIDPSTVPTEAIYDESMANALPGYNYNRFPNFNKNPTRFQNFKDGFGDIKDNFQDGFENVQDKFGDGFENVQDKFGDGFENVQDIIGTGVDKFKSGLGSIKDFAINKGRMGKNLIGSAGAMAMGLPGIVGSGLMSLMGGLKESPEQAAMMDLYNSENYQNVLNQIPGMSNYNPVYGMGAGYGLDRAIGKRLSTLAKTRKKQGDKFSDTLRKREEDLKNLLAQEKAIDFARIGASGRRPGTTGGAYSGESRDSQSRGQASAGNTGGYSYDSGGRQGFGYGLKDGGLASMFTRRR